jgi:hypothetical protein
MAKKFELPLHNRNDTTQMRDTIDVFDRERLAVTRKSPHHLKCGPLNYWPSTGKIHFDDQPKIAEKGLDALRISIDKHRKRLPHLRDEISISMHELIIQSA